MILLPLTQHSNYIKSYVFVNIKITKNSFSAQAEKPLIISYIKLKSLFYFLFEDNKLTEEIV